MIWNLILFYLKLHINYIINENVHSLRRDTYFYMSPRQLCIIVQSIYCTRHLTGLGRGLRRRLNGAGVEHCIWLCPVGRGYIAQEEMAFFLCAYKGEAIGNH